MKINIGMARDQTFCLPRAICVDGQEEQLVVKPIELETELLPQLFGGLSPKLEFEF